MELRESIESINEKLLREYGVEINCGNQPKFRVVFSDDQYEKRWTAYTDEGFELVQPEVRLLPKYKQWIRARYVLERLLPVTGETDLIEKVSYEPAWVFQDKNQNYLPPFFEGCQHIIESMFQLIDKASAFAKYKNKEISPEEHLAHVERMERELFGNETPIGDALAYGSGIVVPENKLIH